PALQGSVEAAHDRLIVLRGPAPEVALGIAADGILFGEDKIESSYSQRLAQSLYTRGVAVLRFSRETTAADLETFLRILGGTAAEQPAPIWEQLTAAGVMSIHLQPVDYSAVQMTDGLDAKPKTHESVSLWDDIVRALLAGRELTGDASQRLMRDIRSVDQLSAMIAKYIDAPDELLLTEFDPNATIGVRVRQPGTGRRESESIISARVADAIGRYVAGSAGSRRQLAVQQIVQLLRSLPDAMRRAVLRSVLRSLASDEGAGSLLREVTAEMPSADVLDALRYVGTMSTLSTHATLLLQSLIQTAAPAAGATPASPAAIAELVKIFGEDDIDRFNPPDHKALLTQVSIYVPESPAGGPEAMQRLGDRVGTVADDVLNRLLGRTLLTLLARFGARKDSRPIFERLESLFRAHLAAGEFAEALNLVERCQELALLTQSDSMRTGAEESLQRLADNETIDVLIESLLAAQPQATATIQRLALALGSVATQTLLIRLAEENNRSRRRKLFDFVTSLGPVIAADVKSFLDDSRWYVVRNMILVLRATNDRSTLPEMRRLAQHPDLRVRLEAIKSLLVLDSSVPQNLLENALNDRDPKLAETAVTLVGNYGIREGVGPLLKILDGTDMFGSRKLLRVRAIKALGELAEPSALRRMQKFFRDPFLPWPSQEERRAAFESLANYPAGARLTLVEQGLHSRDPEIRAICEKLRGE
ncbi:MAG: HEAT repeat domain-containing protein, partial [Thermoanaerobaculia bacterium]